MTQQTSTRDTPASGVTWKLLCLAALFLLAFLPRYYSAQALGWDWDGPGSFTLINFDEAGSCRAALGGFEYSTFIGRQTIALASAVDIPPPPGIEGDAGRVKAYCHSAGHIQVARLYSALLGALTVVLLAWIALMLVPGRPAVAWTAGALLALSGFHISQSHSATVDAPSVFFIYLFLALMVFAVCRRSSLTALAAAPVLAAAVWVKYWFFAAFAYLALLPVSVWRYVSYGMSPGRVALVVFASAILMGLLSTSEFRAAQLYPVLALWYLVIPWRRIHRPMWAVWLALPFVAYALTLHPVVFDFTTSGVGGRFGTSYGAIGWHKWLRNPLNVPLVLLVGLGLPALLFIPAGIRYVVRERARTRAWLCLLLPVLVFALYMAFVAPVTYYRHYLALLPAAALLSACGLFATRWGGRPWFLALFLAWPAALAVDLVADFHRDPRIEFRQWAAEHRHAGVYASFYVSPPPGNYALFKPEYAAGDAAALRRADYLVLSENWYDTAFANELNGPLVNAPRRLVKTKPEYAAFYRAAIAGEHPLLVPERSLDVQNFMPELLFHKAFYGTFQLFVGDLKIFRVSQ
jgi:hypothetical protein